MPPHDDHAGSHPDESILRTEALTRTFGANLAVSDVSISVAAGRLHSIIGPNGAGKTTLFNLLTGDLPPTSGRILFRSADITAEPPHVIARLGVGRSYQITSVFPDLTVLQNVWLSAYRAGRKSAYNFWSDATRVPEITELAERALADMGLTKHAKKPASTLSYGDQRLLELAVTLAGSPELLLLDEPTSGLSNEETGRVGEIVAGLVPEWTILMIEHNMDIVMNISDTITVMDFGAVIAEGPPDAVRDDARVRRAYLGT